MKNLVAFVLLLLMALLAGCGDDKSASVAAVDPKAAEKAVAKAFGNAMLSNDWSTAYAMTTPEFQKAVPRLDMQNQYVGLVSKIFEDDPKYTPNLVEVDEGALPASLEEATSKYHIQNPPPKETWKAWMAASIGQGKKAGIDRGVDAWMLIVEVGGELKIAHVNFEFMD
jgi:hypothetical protein